MMRTHICGELNENLVGKEVTLCGWVDTRRDHGKLIFIDLRDRYGKVQVVFTPKPHPDTYAIAKDLHNEYVVRITGDVNRRPEKTENPNLATGKIELFAKKLEILNSSAELPFSLEEVTDVGEETRLFHRYLDLRRQKSVDTFTLRHACNQAFRTFLNADKFLEVETPFLTKSTPEGARDFLLPCRLQSGKFYALPQSPQLFKQILMVSGMDRYYQVVRCFRDEDLRRDRQPEFSQLDLEMSFVEEEDIFSLSERMFAAVFEEVLKCKLPIPFPRITYREAMERYATDAPDIGEGDWRFVWVTDFPLFEFSETEKRWQSQHHPFTAPHPDDTSLLDRDLSRVRARAYDLVLNGTEIASGSIRIHNNKLQEKIFQLIGIPDDEARQRFGFLLRAFTYGVPPHGGIAFGLDRLYAIMTGSESIREVIAFPKTQRGVCPLTGAPSEVPSEQLRELSVQLIEKKNE